MRGSRHFYDRGSNQNGNIMSQTRGWSNPKKIPKLPFLSKIFRFQGGGGGGGVRTTGPPPSGSAHDLDPFTARSILETWDFTWEKVKTMDF